MSETKKRTRVAHPRSPAQVLGDLLEASKMISQVAARYGHAYDYAYSSGGGGNVAAGGGRTDIKDSKPTEAAALANGADPMRIHLERAGREAKKMVDAAHAMHAELVKAMPGADPYQPTWKPGDRDAIATRAERAETAIRQQQRIRRGEL